MLSFLFASATCAQKTSGYEEYKISYINPATITIPTNYEAVVLLSFDLRPVTLKVTSTSGSIKTHYIYDSAVRSFRVEGSQFTISTDSSYSNRIGVWLIPNELCYGAAIGISGNPNNYSIRFLSSFSTPSNVCIFPMADENSFMADVVFGSAIGTAYFYTDKYLTGKITTYQYCKDNVCKLNKKEEDQWFVRYTSFSTSYPLVLNYNFDSAQTDFLGCYRNTMLSYNQDKTSYYYSNVSSYSCGIDISGIVGYIVAGVILGLVVIVVIIVLICCWPCIVACCCAAAAAGGASASRNSNVNEPLPTANSTYNNQYSPQYNQQYPQQYQQQYPPQYPPQQYPPQQAYSYDYQT